MNGRVSARFDGLMARAADTHQQSEESAALERIMREARPDADFAVASNPEFLREGARRQAVLWARAGSGS